MKEKIMQLQDEIAQLRRENAQAREQALAARADSQLSKAEAINGLNVLFVRMDDAETDELKSHAELLRNKMQNGLVFLTSVKGEKVTFVCAASKEAIAKGFKAGDLVKAAAQVTGGNGGGRPDMAQAGGRNVAAVEEALNTVKAKLNA